MKSQFKFVLFSFIIFLTACGSGEFQSQLAPNSFNGLKALEKNLHFNIDKINGNPVNAESIKINDLEKIIIEGWVVDPEMNSTVSEVFVLINDKVFTTEYGFPRSDVASHFNNKMAKNCGFLANIPLSSLKKGSHKITISAINTKNKATYYKTPTNIDIDL